MFHMIVPLNANGSSCVMRLLLRSLRFALVVLCGMVPKRGEGKADHEAKEKKKKKKERRVNRN
jgi:hypothetical protein